VVGNRIDAEAHHLCSALGKLLFQAGDGSQFCGANGRDILGVGEEYSPTVANPLMELDRTLGSLSRDVGSNIVDAQ
jgi:hypothetical protein